MNTFLKCCAVIALCLVGGCIVVVAFGTKVVHDASQGPAVNDAKEAIQEMMNAATE